MVFYARQLKATTSEACAIAESARASEKMLTAALRGVRNVVAREKRAWEERLREARDESTRLRTRLDAMEREMGMGMKSRRQWRFHRDREDDEEDKEEERIVWKSTGRSRRRGCESEDSLYVYPDGEASSSSEDESSDDVSRTDEEDEQSLREAADVLRSLSITLSDAASERKAMAEMRHRSGKTISFNMNTNTNANTKANANTTRSVPAGETARRALRARHAMRNVNYTEPSLKVKLRRDENYNIIVGSSSGSSVPQPTPRALASDGKDEYVAQCADSPAREAEPTASPKSPAEIFADIPREPIIRRQESSFYGLRPEFEAPASSNRLRRRAADGIDYAEPSLIRKLRRPF